MDQAGFLFSMQQVNLPFKEILPGKYLNLDKVVLFEVVRNEAIPDGDKGSWILSIQTMGSEPDERIMLPFSREVDAFRAMGINRSNLAMFS